MQYHFQWGAKKAFSNHQKHNIHFRDAVQVFRDPLAMTLFDQDHSETEDRWVTLGQLPTGKLLVVSHMFEQIDVNMVIIRMISARPATKHESRQYQEGDQQ